MERNLSQEFKEKIVYSLKTLNEIQYKKEMDLEIHRLKYDSIASIKARQKAEIEKWEEAQELKFITTIL